MNITTAFIRVFFVLISVIFMISFALGITPASDWTTYVWGILLGLLIGALLIGLDIWFKRFNLRSFNIVVIGLFIGYLMGTALLIIFEAILDIASLQAGRHVVEIIKIFLFLFGTYLGVMMTLRASDEFYVSIPFVKFAPQAQNVKDILLDYSTLSDARIIDLAASGLLDRRLILPRFILMEIQSQEEFGDEMAKTRAKRASEVIKKMETMPGLGLRYQDTDFPDVKDITNKVLRLARLLDADVLSADISRIQMAQIENVRIINIHSLSNALKPLMQRGEIIKIKIQRQGKEERQGVGYLEDGTMVVVNGGGDFIGKTIEASVLSVKHTTSGRIIFCNAQEDQAGKQFGEEDEY